MHQEPAHERPDIERRAYRKAGIRLIPFLFFCYILSYLDRVNIGFARLQMSADIGLGEAAYGAGAGMFFIGYMLFEVPSNMILARVGARVWIARIMITWGLVASLQAMVATPSQLYLVRFLLGVAEAGFFPGIILYLTLWFPSEYRARMIAWFMTAVAMAGVLGGPVSGYVLEALDGLLSLRGWQWLFIVEGLPASVAGIWVLYYLDDGPEKAGWLGDDERELLSARYRSERSGGHDAPGTAASLAGVIASPRVWLLTLLYFFAVMGVYGIAFWLPQIIHDSITADPESIGWISSIPWLAGAVGMVLNGMHSDRSAERRWHIALPALGASAAFFLSSLPAAGGWYGVAALSVATAGVMSVLSAFWTLPPAVLSGTVAAAAGIALINSFGNVAGYVSPWVAGLILDAAGPHGMSLVLLLFSASMLACALLAVLSTRR